MKGSLWAEFVCLQKRFQFIQNFRWNREQFVVCHTFCNAPPAYRYWYRERFHRKLKTNNVWRDSIKISLHEHDNLISFSILMLSAFLAPWHENCWLQNITRDETVWENSWTRHQSLKMHHRIFTTQKNAAPWLHGEKATLFTCKSQFTQITRQNDK